MDTKVDMVKTNIEIMIKSKSLKTMPFTKYASNVIVNGMKNHWAI